MITSVTPPPWERPPQGPAAEAPALRTERLVLRAHRLEDFDAYATLWASDRVRHMGGSISRTQAWYAFASDVALWPLTGLGCWAIELRENGALAGQVGVQRPPHFPETELGWLVFDGFEGKGIAYEAALAARDWAYSKHGLPDLVSYIDGANTRSIAVAERLGAELDANAHGPHPDDLVYRHPSPEALQ